MRFVGCLDGGARVSSPYASTRVRRRWTTGKRLACLEPTEGAFPTAKLVARSVVSQRTSGTWIVFLKQGKRSKRPTACLAWVVFFSIGNLEGPGVECRRLDRGPLACHA